MPGQDRALRYVMDGSIIDVSRCLRIVLIARGARRLDMKIFAEPNDFGSALLRVRRLMMYSESTAASPGSAFGHALVSGAAAGVSAAGAGATRWSLTKVGRTSAGYLPLAPLGRRHH